MKKLLLCLIFIFASMNASEYGKGRLFAGGELGLGGIGSFSAGAIAGYQFYFPQSKQPIDGFRQGLRGYVKASYANYAHSVQNSNYSWNALYGGIGADYLLDFNPGDNVVFGVFGGLNLGATMVSSPAWYKGKLGGFGLGLSLGATATIHKIHKVELIFGTNLSLGSIRYLYLF